MSDEESVEVAFFDTIRRDVAARYGPTTWPIASRQPEPLPRSKSGGRQPTKRSAPPEKKAASDARAQEKAKKLAQQKEFATRVQRIIDERYDSFYTFKRDHPTLARAVHNWTPPQERWKNAPNGAEVRDADWKKVKLPRTETLMQFCEVFQTRADYILFGEGAPYRGQSRDKAELEHDIAAVAKRALKDARGPAYEGVSIDAAALCADLVAAVTQDADEWQTWLTREYIPRFRGVESLLEVLELSVRNAGDLRAQGNGEAADKLDVQNNEIRDRIEDLSLELRAMYRAPKYFQPPDTPFYRSGGSIAAQERLRTWADRLSRGESCLRPVRVD